MDFLDPRRRKAHRRRLMIGYALMSIVIAIGTMIVLYLAQGWDIDRKTGEIIQNGIVFMDSKPGGATLFVNDVQQGSRTNTRMVLPAGDYTVRLELEGYRTWERTFSLQGGQIQRLVYPFLIPNTFTTSDVGRYDVLPQLATQSPDRRWVLVQKPNLTYQFDVYDIDNVSAASSTLTIPLSIITSPGTDATLKAIEWSNDNRHVLMSRVYQDKTEFLIVDRDNPSQSININKLLGINPVVVSLKNKRPDQIYYMESKPGILRSGDTRGRTLSAPLAQGVIDYKSYDDNLILYATQENVAEGKTDFRVLEGERTLVLKTVKQSDNYVLDVSRYDGDWYYVVGSSAENMAFVYENPLPTLKQETRTPLIVTAILRLDNPRFVSFSANTQFIGLQSGNQILSLDLEDRRQYRVTLEHPIPVDKKLKWMDGHRFLYVVSGQSYFIEFDGSNEETLVTQLGNMEPFFDGDYDNILTFEDSKSDQTKKALTLTVLEP